eukprot:2391867-Karenia_brevis.AAC.1
MPFGPEVTAVEASKVETSIFDMVTGAAGSSEDLGASADVTNPFAAQSHHNVSKKRPSSIGASPLRISSAT